jgi:Na+/H+-translocating membrane pyrophosphatase
LPTPIHKEEAAYCFTGAAAFLLATLDELAVLAVVALVVFLALFFFEVGAVEVVFELCGVTGALEGGVLCANIAAAANMEIKIVRFIFVFSFLRGAFDLPFAIPSCGHMLFGTLAPAGDVAAPPRGIDRERLLMKKR